MTHARDEEKSEISDDKTEVDSSVPGKLDDILQNRLAVPDARSLSTESVRTTGVHDSIELSRKSCIVWRTGANRVPVYSPIPSCLRWNALFDEHDDC